MVKQKEYSDYIFLELVPFINQFVLLDLFVVFIC